MPIITVEDLHHTYLENTPFAHTVLRGVNLTIEEGELVGVVGPSRAGKSTLAGYLNALAVPRRGRVVVDGVDTSAPKADLRALRQRVGLVFQYPEDQLFAPTVGEDVAFGPRNAGVPAAQVEERVVEALRAVGLDPELRTRDPHALSGGQKRRVAIAGVLALRPKVLILDDPIAGLDPRGRDGILSWVAGLHRHEGLTVVLVSNSLEEIAPLLERVVVMAGGRVAAVGPPREVFADVELLRRVGLGVLPTVELMEALRGAGHDVPLGVLDEHEAAEILAGLAVGAASGSARGVSRGEG